MPRIAIAFLSFLFLVPQGLRAASFAYGPLMTNQAPNMNTCSPPSSSVTVTTFTTNDKAAYLWFYLSGTNVNDVIEADFYANGKLYIAPTHTVTANDSPCYDVELDIANTTPATPTGTWTVNIFYNGLRIGTVPFTITAAPACTYSLPTSSASVPATGGSFSFTVTMGSGCPTPSGTIDVTWITGTITGSTVNFTVDPNTGTSSRTGHITVNGQTFTVTQAAPSPCTYSLSSSSASVAAAAGSGSFTVTTGSGCTVSASSDAPTWLTPTVSGTTVNYTVTADTSTSSRTGHIAVNGQTFTVTQAGASGGGTTTGNLIQNGDAESGPHGTGTDAAQPTIPSWNTDGQIAVTSYAGGAGDLSPTTPGPPNPGSYYFAGGPNNASSQMTQTVDLSGYATAIDTGSQAYTLDGWLGGYSTQNDNAAVTVTFQNASGGSLGTATIGPVLSSDRNGVSSLVERSATGNIPTGTRKMLVTVTFTRTDGAYNDGALDNLSFVLGGGGSTATGSITIANPGFETIPSNIHWINCAGSGGAGSGGAGCQDTLDGNIPGWTASSTQIGLFQPGPNYFTLPWPVAEGQTAAQVNSGTLSQVLSTTLQASTLYTLQVDVGRRLDNLYPSTPPTAQLFAGNTPIASATGAQPALGGWATWTGTYTSSASDPLAGQALKIVLGATAAQGDFDNVRLTSAPGGGGTTATGNFTFNGFTSAAGLTMVGSAAPFSSSVDGTVLRLTPALKNQDGAAYSTTPVTLGNNATFSTQFQFRFSQAGGTKPADGITFVLATNATGLGSNGYGMGYQGVSGNSVAIEFDTYDNTNIVFNDGNSSNHVAIDTNGNLTNTNLTNVYGKATCDFSSGNPNTAAGCMSNGDLWTVNINYDGSKLTVTLTDPAEGSSFTAINGYAINLASVLGQNTAYVGFTAGTGNGFENHDIVSWTFANTAQAACTYSLSTSSASVAAGSGNFSFTVTASSGCTLSSPTSDVNWIPQPTVSGTTVNYTVQANSSTSSRIGHITVSGQTFTVTQAAAAACSYLITPTSYNMAALGGSSNITVTVTGASCSWTASVSASAASWLHLGQTTSGTTNGSVNFTGDANTSMGSRTGIITVANQQFTVTQAGGASPTAPSINAGGIVNALDSRGGPIAQGSFFTIYGTNLGPAAPGQGVTQFPFNTNLGGVTVTVTQGSTTKQAYPHYVSALQINAIMPSDAPLGNVQITVAYNGVIGAAAAATVVNNAFGIMGVGSGPGEIQNWNSATDEPVNSASKPAKPGQIEIIWGTGLGPIGTPDNQPPQGGNLPLPVQVWVGGERAPVQYSGRAPGFPAVDNIYFTVPSDVTLGCYIPVQVNAGGTWSNTVRIAISSDGKQCQDTFNPFNGLSSNGGKSGTLGLIRVNFSDPQGQTEITSATVDLGIGAFATNAGSTTTYSPITNLPPPGTCVATNKMLNLTTVMDTGGSSLDPTITAALDAGPQLTVTGGAGGATATITRDTADEGPTAPYLKALGGILTPPISGFDLGPLFLDGGPFTVSNGTGGTDVKAFTTTIPLAPAITWTNPPSTINRSSPLTLTWTGGNSSQMILILGGSTDTTSNASGGFTCLAPAAPGTFTVPANALTDMIPVGPVTSSSNTTSGMVSLMPLQPGNMQFTKLPTGLDVGVAFNTTMTVRTVQVQ